MGDSGCIKSKPANYEYIAVEANEVIDGERTHTRMKLGWARLLLKCG